MGRERGGEGGGREKSKSKQITPQFFMTHSSVPLEILQNVQHRYMVHTVKFTTRQDIPLHTNTYNVNIINTKQHKHNPVLHNINATHEHI